jgi:hypothetical protein
MFGATALSSEPAAPTANGAAHYDVVAAPTVVGAVAVTDERPAKIRCGEGGDIVDCADFGGCRVERGERPVNAAEQSGVVGVEAVVAVEAAHRDEEDLSIQAKLVPPGRDQSGDHLQLFAEAIVGELGGDFGD